MRQLIPEFRATSGELVVVGSGSPYFAKAFRQDMGLGDVPIRCDVDLRSYALAGFTRGVLATLNPRAALNYVRALRSGQRQHRLQGDALQQGGALVVTRDGVIAYRFVSKAAGDHPPPAAMIDALRRSA